MIAEFAVSPDAGAPLVPPPAPRRTALRRVPVPPQAPPYDDESAASGGAELRGALLLPFAAPSTSVPRLRVLPPPDETSARRTPPPGPWSTRFVRTVLETLAGLRPVSQLGVCATPDVCRVIARRVALAEGCRDLPRGLGKLRSIHVCAPSSGAAEVCAVIDYGTRVRAIALRIEVSGEAWRCTELLVG